MFVFDHFACCIGPMFPGDECYPFTIKDSMNYASGVDQLERMLDLIGFPDESEIVKIANEKARKYVRILPQRKPKNLKRMFPGCDKHALDLLLQLLKFDTDKRISAKDAMQHSYLNGYMNDETDDQLRSEDENALSFQNEDLSMDQYREMILQEISAHKDDVIVNGYIRKYIEPLLGSIPLDIVTLLCAVFSGMI